MPTVFEDRYAKLNPRQREAVDTIEGPVMVIAGPGTGKTTILTLRIANILLKTDTPPSGILAITFTEAGVKAMRMKLREVIGSRADEVRIHTFHGLAASVINEFPDHFPHISRARQLTDIESEAIIRGILTDKAFTKLRPFGNPDLYLASIIRTISDSKKEAWTPAMLRSFADGEVKRIQGDEASISTRGATKGELKADAKKRIEKCEKTLMFADIFEAYEAKKKTEQAIDFDDLIIETILAFERDELLLQIIQERFLYILVDEHQDTNDSQNLLVRMIASFFDNPNLFVVGDEKQAIYRFQGASVENFLSLQNIWKDMKLISLSDNYRSHQSILDASFSLIEENYAEGEHERLRVKLSSGAKKPSKPIEIVKAGNAAALEERLAHELSKLPDRYTAAVIVRTNRDVERILGILESHGVEASAERGADIFSHPLGSIYFDLLGFLGDHSKTELFARTLSVGLWNLPLARSGEIIREIRAGRSDSIESVPAAAQLVRDIGKAGAVEYLIKAGELSGIIERAVRDPLSAEVWRGIIALAQDIARRDSIIDPKTLVEALLSYRLSAQTKSVKAALGKMDARVTVMTAHGSKGLEFDYVYMPFATEESWMPRARSSYFALPRQKDEDESVRDARRLFYVAMTRAREHLVIIVELADHMGRDHTPVRFIDEIDRSQVQIIDVPPVMSVPVASNKNRSERAVLVEFAKRSILERGLSVTALNHFALCPNLFFYKSVMRVPEPPSASSEKGNAMHEAMARAWKLEDKSEKSITSAIIDTVREYLARSLLPAFEKEALEDELVSAAPKVAKALVPQLSLSGTSLVETWAETPFMASAGGKEIECRLHGKLDAILETDSKVSVFDYKTREALSIAAIRGETKSDDGGYFRQLIFYRMLLSGNPKYIGKTIEPSLVFIKPDEKGRCPVVSIQVTADDLERVKGEVSTLLATVWNGEILMRECGDPKCDGCKLWRASGAGI